MVPVHVLDQMSQFRRRWSFVGKRQTLPLARRSNNLFEISRQQSTTNARLASELRDKILQQKLQLVDTLNRISQARLPVEQALEELNDNLNRKETKILDLQA
jgi:hypothetical protein